MFVSFREVHCGSSSVGCLHCDLTSCPGCSIVPDLQVNWSNWNSWLTAAGVEVTRVIYREHWEYIRIILVRPYFETYFEWNLTGNILRPMWDYIGFMLRSYWEYIENKLTGNVWGIMLGLYWKYTGSILVP